MSREAVISCPKCIRQYVADPSLDEKLGQCWYCKSQFVISVSTLITPGDDPVVFDMPLEPTWVFFRDGCAALTKSACLLLRMAGEPVTIDGVMNIVKSLPRDVDQLLDERWHRGFCNLAMKEAYFRAKEASWESDYREVHEYFTQYIPTHSRNSLDMLINATLGSLGGIDWEAVRGINLAPGRNRGPLERWAARRGW